MALTKTQADGINLGDTFTYTGTLQVESEGGAVNTSIQHGVAKIWVNFNGTGTIAVRDSLNVTSLTDEGTGQYDVNYTNATNASDYFYTSLARSNSIVAGVGAISAMKTTRIDNMEYYTATANTTIDREIAGIVVHGDLA